MDKFEKKTVTALNKGAAYLMKWIIGIYKNAKK